MTEAEKITALQTGIAPDTEEENILLELLLQAESLIMNRLFPFGYAAGTAMPSRYDRIQIQLAIELFSHRGAEGQTGHNENGISRTWPEKNRLLSMIMPQCGSVTPNA